MAKKEVTYKRGDFGKVRKYFSQFDNYFDKKGVEKNSINASRIYQKLKSEKKSINKANVKKALYGEFGYIRQPKLEVEQPIQPIKKIHTAESLFDIFMQEYQGTMWFNGMETIFKDAYDFLKSENINFKFVISTTEEDKNGKYGKYEFNNYVDYDHDIHSALRHVNNNNLIDKIYIREPVQGMIETYPYFNFTMVEKVDVNGNDLFQFIYQLNNINLIELSKIRPYNMSDFIRQEVEKETKELPTEQLNEQNIELTKYKFTELLKTKKEYIDKELIELKELFKEKLITFKEYTNRKDELYNHLNNL